MDWPYVEYDANGDPIYPSLTENYTASELRDFTAFVDLTSSEVVQIIPGPEAIIVP